MTGSTITDNSALGGAGGAGFAAGPGVGGGVEIGFNSTATISNSTIAHNQAIDGAGAEAAAGGLGAGGGIAVAFGTLFGILVNSSLTLIGSRVGDDLAQGGAGDTGANGGAGQGGGVFVAAGSSAEIELTIIMRNQALGEPAGPGAATARVSVAASTSNPSLWSPGHQDQSQAQHRFDQQR